MTLKPRAFSTSRPSWNMKSQIVGAVVFGVIKYLPIKMCFVYYRIFVCAFTWVVCDGCRSRNDEDGLCLKYLSVTNVNKRRSLRRTRLENECINPFELNFSVSLI
jgi:hypothetical protein